MVKFEKKKKFNFPFVPFRFPFAIDCSFYFRNFPDEKSCFRDAKKKKKRKSFLCQQMFV